jgi:hypothetical protein
MKTTLYKLTLILFASGTLLFGCKRRTRLTSQKKWGELSRNYAEGDEVVVLDWNIYGCGCNTHR